LVDNIEVHVNQPLVSTELLILSASSLLSLLLVISVHEIGIYIRLMD